MVWRASVIGPALLLIAGCSCKLTEPTYRFELAFDSAPTAYRNVGNAAENLVVAMRVRNVAAGDLCISGPTKSGDLRQGLTVSARLISPNPFLAAGMPKVSYGLRAGAVLRDVSKASSAPLFDRHNNAVRDFAGAAEVLVGMDRDKTITTFRLLGNETMVLLKFPVNWSAVPNSPLVIESQMPIEVTLGYKGEKGETFRFSETFRYRTRIYFINSGRGFGDLRPGGGGPKTGKFVPVTP